MPDTTTKQPGSTAEALAARATAGAIIPVRCVCGYDARGTLVLQDRYTQDMPPGPRGHGSWLEVCDAQRDEGVTACQCPECGEDWPDAVAERPGTSVPRCVPSVPGRAAQSPDRLGRIATQERQGRHA